MNCAELRADIAKLEEKSKNLDAKIQAALSGDASNKSFETIEQLVGADSIDQILEKYLKDFVKYNPDIFPPHLELGERIDIKNANGKPAHVNSIVATKDGRVLIGGWSGALYSGYYDNEGKLVLGERIDIKDAAGNSAYAWSIATTEDGQVLIGGLRRTLFWTL